MSLVFLIGFMGCGKTTHGRKLAKLLKIDFVDLDEVFERENGPINAYFNAFGEDNFRQKESELLKQTAYPENAIISTGGGLPVFFDNMDWMKHHGRIVYLEVPPKVIAARMETAKTKRPLLQYKTGDELLQFIIQKLDEREPFYRQATLIIDGVDLTVKKLASLLKL